MPITDLNIAYNAWAEAQDKDFALNTLVKEMEKFARAVCWNRLPDHNRDFSPLVNGIVWRAIKKNSKFCGKSKYSTWFYRIIVNECNRYLRKYKERHEIALEEEMPCKVEAVDARVDLIGLLDALEGPDHMLFRMLMDGEDFNTIADAFGISRNTAIQRWNRLKLRLRDAV